MGQSLLISYLHITFSTKLRRPFLSDEETRQKLYTYMAGICRELGGDALIINGVKDHVHLLIRQPKTKSVSDFMRELKKSSSIWMHNHTNQSDFHWQDGYGAFSISPAHIDAVKQYILTQEKHHKKVTFKEELLRLLKKYDADFDERYLWD